MEEQQGNDQPQQANLATRLHWKIIVPILVVFLLVAAVALGSSQQLLARGNGPGPELPGAGTVIAAPRHSTPPADSAVSTPTPSLSSAQPSSSPAATQPTSPQPAPSAPASAAGPSTPAQTSKPAAITPEAAAPAAITPEAAAPERITVPAAGIDVAVLPLTPTQGNLDSQSIVPPFTEDGYWLTSYGMPGTGSQNTTYITGHSWADREAPFDRLSTHTEVGDTVSVTTGTGTLTYIVDSITTHDKNTLRTSDIWNIVPHRLVLISCYTDDPWGKNVVVTASPA